MARRGLLLELVRGRERCLVDRDDFVIGRARDCGLPVLSIGMSRQHARIRRTERGWTIEDLGSAGGTLIDGSRIAGPHLLRLGNTIRIADATLRVIDLDHVAAPGELLGPVDRKVTYACAGVTCVARVKIETSTGNAELERELAALIAGSADHPVVADGNTVAVSTIDPIAEILAVRDLVTRLSQPLAAIAVSATVSELLIDGNALALLREDAAPARAAWDWLHALHPVNDLIEPVAHVIGFEVRWRADMTAQAVPPELMAVRVPEGPGVLLWIQNRQLGQLVWIDRPMRIAPPEPLPTVEQAFTVELARVGGTWTLTSLARDRAHHVLEVGKPITIWYSVFEPVALRI